jgi:hypothetical protein
VAYLTARHISSTSSARRTFLRLAASGDGGGDSSDSGGDSDTPSYAEFARVLQGEEARAKVHEAFRRQRVQLKMLFYTR